MNPQEKFLSTVVHRQSTTVIHDLGITRLAGPDWGDTTKCGAPSRRPEEIAPETAHELAKVGAIPAGRANAAVGTPLGKTCG